MPSANYGDIFLVSFLPDKKEHPPSIQADEPVLHFFIQVVGHLGTENSWFEPFPTQDGWLVPTPTPGYRVRAKSKVFRYQFGHFSNQTDDRDLRFFLTGNKAGRNPSAGNQIPIIDKTDPYGCGKWAEEALRLITNHGMAHNLKGNVGRFMKYARKADGVLPLLSVLPLWPKGWIELNFTQHDEITAFLNLQDPNIGDLAKFIKDKYKKASGNHK